MDEIDNPFDGEAARLINQQGVSEQEARDFVVLRHLAVGDTRALAHWLMTDYIPGPGIRRLLSWMLQPTRHDADDPKITFESHPDIVAFELKIVGRPGKRTSKTDPVKGERNQALKDYYDARLSVLGRGCSEAVIAEMIDEFGPEVSESKIREATKARSPKSG